MKIAFITSNQGKVLEAKSLLAPLGIEVNAVNVFLTEIQAVQEEVSIHKALEARKFEKGDLVIEDTGFYISAFNGFPGAFAAPIIRQIGPSGFLKLVQGTDRKAFFKTVVAFLASDSKQPLLFTGICSGKIAEKITVSHPKLLFDSIFIPSGENCTFGEMSLEEKNKYSHRRKAFTAFVEYLRENK